MKIQLLIGIADEDYREHLSRRLTEHYSDTFEINVCSANGNIPEMVNHRCFDVALLDSSSEVCVTHQGVKLPILLWDGSSSVAPEIKDLVYIRKYQRISKIVSEILERYAEISESGGGFPNAFAKVTAVWSPAGGVGKTTVALAYATQKAEKGDKIAYLDLEPFSSIEVYFQETGKSISTVLDKLKENSDLLLQSIRQEDRSSGVYYFCKPNNYDDISVLTTEDIEYLLNGCAAGLDELVVDLGSTFNERVRYILETVSQILLVLDNTRTCQMKWNQFCSQHDLYGMISEKLKVVANKGAKIENKKDIEVISLPMVRHSDPIAVYKTLSSGYFDL